MTSGAIEAQAYGTVLVPLDGSHLAAAALPHAVAVARRFGAPLVLLHVMAEPSESMPAEALERRASRGQFEAYLEGLKRSLDRYEVEVQFRMETGKTAPTIARVAQGLGDAVIVMSRVGRTAALPGKDKDSFGGVAVAILQDWRGPLLLVTPYS